MMRATAPSDLIRPAIPGLVLRPYRHGDGALLAELNNADSEADGLPWRTTADEMENWFARATPSFDATRDAFMLELDGRVVGTSDLEWVDTTDGFREFRIGCALLPEVRRRGIGRWLLRLNEELAAVRLAELPTERPAILGSWSPDRRVGKVALLEQEGYRPARYFFDMLRPTLDEIVVPPMPDGLDLRPVGDQQLRQLWDADVEAFIDHWGGFDGSDARYETWRSDPKFDPSLFMVAWDGSEIAGGVVNEINAAENAALGRLQGWLASVFVRRQWRRRGLARALVMRSLAILRERGMTSAGLGVDADNANEALRLYTECGFEVDFRSVAYRKPLVP
ncbi:MAG: GNAT family N-acetyltransferase, partial [Chloroflexota bacterium]|nr:GNAT family N-acetyltransferase [Chloroflexota bacterium]